MIGDVKSVVWKEARELLQGGSRGRLAPLILLVIYGVFFPIQAGSQWVDSYQMIVFALILPVFLVLAVVADTFAGERERHTLETLLASRLSDRAILIGKIGAVVIYGWGLTIASLIVALFVVNATAGAGHILLYSAGLSVAMIILTFLMALFGASIGVLVSLRAATVRQAQQTLTIGWIAIVFLLVFVVRDMPSTTRAHLVHLFNGLNLTEGTIAAIVVLLLIDFVVLAIDGVKFQRARLILD